MCDLCECDSGIKAYITLIRGSSKFQKATETNALHWEIPCNKTAYNLVWSTIDYVRRKNKIKVRIIAKYLKEHEYISPI